MAPAATATLVILLVLLLGGFALASALNQSGTSSAGSSPAATQQSPSNSDPVSQQIGLGNRSPAERLVIPALKVDTHLVGLGNTPANQMELPPARGAGWYQKSVAPGQNGVAVLAGYISRRTGVPGVFANLRKLHRGDSITVHRKDGTTAVFQVTGVRSYATGRFPASTFYQGDGSPLLRIVTTGGRLTPKSPQGNVVVDARIIDVR
ncbi:MAG: sortase [Nocardioidaceae bacterium]|nr:sortase [Nocardioidaceae bacterium]MCL2614598.1 sortase [Nocardioidaceae bacterium]